MTGVSAGSTVLRAKTNAPRNTRIRARVSARAARKQFTLDARPDSPQATRILSARRTALHPCSRRFRAHVLCLSLSMGGLFASVGAHAASLEPVDPSVWGNAGLPSYVNMYLYVPDQLATKPPIVVGAHYCTGTGPAYFGALSSIVSAANSQGFIMILPEATGRNCWDVGSVASLTHDGGGDTQAIAQMVRYTIATYDADPNRVYVVGTS